MDFLNKAFAQLADLFRSMTPGARFTAALLLTVVVVSLGYLFTHDMSGPAVDLMHGVPIPPGQMSAIVAAIGKAKLSDYRIDGDQIKVPRGREAVYMNALAEAKVLPADFSSVLDEELGSGSFMETEKDKEQRRKIAKEKKLGLFISIMPGIERANVVYDCDTKWGLNREKINTASVAVKPIGSEQLDAAKVSTIRHYVAKAFAGLKPEDVAVSDLNGRTWYGDAANGGGADDNVYASIKRNYEQELKVKILDALSYIPNVTVESTVTLDKEKFSEIHEVKHDPKTTVVRQVDSSTTRSQESGGTAGRVGLPAQAPNAAATLGAGGAGGSKEEEDQSKSEILNVTSGSEKNSATVGLTPKLAKVAVGIPVSYFKKVWLQRNPPEEGKESKGPDLAALDQIRTEVTTMIQKHVAPLLPLPEGGADPTEYVTVSTFQDIPGKEIPAPGMAQSAMTWLGEYWSMLGMIVVAMVSLLMLRSLVRSAPSVAVETRAMPKLAAATAAEEAEAAEAAGAAAGPGAPKSRLKRFTSGGPSLIDELSEMVKEDPDTAANILRGWISSTT
jgi:flagellar M-ring protein FliF